MSLVTLLHVTATTSGAWTFAGGWADLPTGLVAPAWTRSAPYPTATRLAPSLTRTTIVCDLTLRSRCGIVIRGESVETYLVVELDPATNATALYRVTGGSRTVLIQSRAEPLTLGATYRIRVDLDDDIITLFTPSGQRVASISETQGLHSRTYGAIQYGTPGSTFAGLLAGQFEGQTINWPRFTNRHAEADIEVGPPGSWEDTDINNPNIVWDPVGERYVMYYTGYSRTKPTADDGVQMAGIAYADSLHGPWTKEPLNPVIDDLDTGQWSQNGGMERLADGTWIIAANVNLGGGVMGTWFYTAPHPSGPWTKTPTAITDFNGDPYLRINQITGALEHWSWRLSSNKRVGVRRTSTDGGVTWSAPVEVVPTPPLFEQNNGELVVFVPPGKEGEQIWYVADFFPFGTLPAGRGMLMGLSLDQGASWLWHVLVTPDGSLGWDKAAAFDSYLAYDEAAKQLFLYHSGVEDGIDTGTLNMKIQLGHAWAAWDHTKPPIA